MRSWLFLNKNERSATLLLLIIALVVAILQWLPFSPYAFVLLDDEEGEKVEVYSVEDKDSLVLFVFDPNTIDSLQLDSMNLPPKVSDMLLRYRRAGGRFVTGADLLKIYTMDSCLYEQLLPYVHIEASPVVRAKREGQLAVNRRLKLHAFNPNTIDSFALVDMGLREGLIKVWLNYRQAGGYFYEAKDLHKLYGIKADEVQQLLPYVVIPVERVHYDSVSAVSLSEELFPIEINSSDTNLLMKVKGIGRVFSRRIVAYRELLGGYYRKNQLLEVYGMKPDYYEQIVSQIRVDTAFVVRLRINKVSEKELYRHPYISFKQAKAICRYRYERGYWDEAGLKSADLFDAEQLEKLLPYLDFH